ncbi:MAG: protein phosphatase 2C domain-containing protein [Desulfobacula sp.]|nr:protein phosphatase 2C domain-containing protein [Desulfobacula sp.]
MITEHIIENGSGNTNEDALILENSIYGVFDGATSLDSQTFENGKTGGQIASATARSVFSRNCHPLDKLAQSANMEILNQMHKHGVDISAKENLWSTSAAVIRIKKDMLEWVQTGDAVIVLIYKDKSHKVLVVQEDLDHETLTMWKKLAKKDVATAGKKGIHKLLQRQIKKIRAGMNKTYGVLNGEKEADHFLNHGIESLDQVASILLFTDGLSLPQKTPAKFKDFAPLVDLYLALGLNGLKNKIRTMEKNDPDCTRYPRFKCHDDIAAIAITCQN